MTADRNLLPPNFNIAKIMPFWSFKNDKSFNPETFLKTFINRATEKRKRCQKNRRDVKTIKNLLRKFESSGEYTLTKFFNLFSSLKWKYWTYKIEEKNISDSVSEDYDCEDPSANSTTITCTIVREAIASRHHGR